MYTHSLEQLEAKLSKRSIERICILKPSAFGDVIQSLPLVPVLKERFKDSKISWVINDQLLDLVAHHPQIDSAIPFFRHGGPMSWQALLRHLRSQKFDLVIDLQGLLRTGIMAWSTRAPIRIGLETAREGSRFFNHLLLPDTSRLVPAWQRYWRVAEALGLGEFQRQTVLPVSSNVESLMTAKLMKLGGNYIAIHAGAKWESKRWPASKHARLAAKAALEYQKNLVIIGTNEESELAKELVFKISRESPSIRTLNLCGRTSLAELNVVLRKADCLITNDSGPMHMAAALGTPVVGLFTCTSPTLSGPPESIHELISTNVDCAGSYKKRCPHKGLSHMCCMEELSIARAWNGVVRVMKELDIPKKRSSKKAA